MGFNKSQLPEINHHLNFHHQQLLSWGGKSNWNSWFTPPFQLRLIISSRFIGHCKEFLRLTFEASALLCNTLNVSFRNSLINLVDKTKLSFYSTPSMQHPSFFRNLPPLFRLVIACFNFEFLMSPYTGKLVRLLFTILLIVCCDYVPFDITKLDGKTLKPFNSQIKFVILLTINHTILRMLVQRIQCWIN